VLQKSCLVEDIKLICLMGGVTLEREFAKGLFKEDGFIEVFVDTPIKNSDTRHEYTREPAYDLEIS